MRTALKQNLISTARKIGRSRLFASVLYRPSIRSKIQTWPGFRILYGKGWELLHPFDLTYGTETSGFISAEVLAAGGHGISGGSVYAGSQPSIIRAALETLPSLESFTFIDLGCGKGRPLLVAAEFPFRQLVGVELAEPLAVIGRKNIAIFQQRKPGLPPIRIETGDASTFGYPNGNLVVFLYNPFGEEIIRKVIAKIEAAIADEQRNVFVVYYNPVYSSVFDRSLKLGRYFAAKLPYGEDELDFGPDVADSVVIWQSGRAKPSLPGANAPIVVTNPGSRAEVAA